MSTKYSKQRALILEELQCRRDHPTADDIYVSLRPKLPNLSLATVYRNLGLLEEHGFLRRIPSNGPDHFDADVSFHHHLICSDCGSVIDVFLPQEETLCKEAESLIHGQIDGYSLIFRGVCSACHEKKQTLNLKSV